MNITSVQFLKDKEVQVVNGENTYVSVGENTAITAVIEGATIDYIPLNPANRHYAEIMRQVAAGTLTIADAE
jgi:hypothetical protein